MMNNSGQAFSVFQLLIAAIIAVAILGVLFGIMGQVGISDLGVPKTEIGNALSAARSGGEVVSKAFGMDSGDRLRSTDFETAGFSGDEIVFYIDEDQLPNDFLADLGGSGDDEYSTVTYSGANPKSLEAKVICMSTGERLSNEMDDVYDNAVSAAGGELCMAGESSASVCCAVIFRRAR